MKYTLFLSCIRGFESICENEIKTLGMEKIKSQNGGVQFEGDLEDIYKTNYSSRYGMNLYWEIENFSFNQKYIYNDINKIKWDKYLNNIHSFSVKVNCSDKKINAHYTALVIKDGIVDYFTKKYGKRPNVDKKNPDIPIYAYIHDNQVKVYINTSGEPLYKRGYRTNNIHEAPLNEVLAANIVAHIEIGKGIFYDPMCGSGTLLIESALKNLNIPSQICRKKFSFMNWFNYDSSLYEKVKQDMRYNIETNNNIFFSGSDNDELSLEMIKGSVEKLQLNDNFIIRRRNFFDFIPNPESTIIFNPPYDIRISVNKDLDKYYEKIGNTLTYNCKNAKIHIFTIDNTALDHIGIPLINSKAFKNGNIDCVLNTYQT